MKSFFTKTPGSIGEYFAYNASELADAMLSGELLSLSAIAKLYQNNAETVENAYKTADLKITFHLLSSGTFSPFRLSNKTVENAPIDLQNALAYAEQNAVDALEAFETEIRLMDLEPQNQNAF